MEETLRLLQFNPQIPFGQLLFTAAWLLATLCVLLYVLKAVRKRGLANRRAILGMTALTLSAPVLYANLTIPDAIDFHPGFTSSDLVGTWAYDGSMFQLDNGGSANLKLNPKLQNRSGIGNGKGTWKKLSAANIVLTGTTAHGGKLLLRAIRHRRELRLIIEETDTPDLWDGDLGFRKQ